VRAEVARGGARLLKFAVCWDAAVCAVSADGFFDVSAAVGEQTAHRLTGLPPSSFSSVTPVLQG
jgi:hypothetical protein